MSITILIEKPPFLFTCPCLLMYKSPLLPSLATLQAFENKLRWLMAEILGNELLMEAPGQKKVAAKWYACVRVCVGVRVCEWVRDFVWVTCACTWNNSSRRWHDDTRSQELSVAVHIHLSTRNKHMSTEHLLTYMSGGLTGGWMTWNDEGGMKCHHRSIRSLVCSQQNFSVIDNSNYSAGQFNKLIKYCFQVIAIGSFLN